MGSKDVIIGCLIKLVFFPPYNWDTLCGFSFGPISCFLAMTFFVRFNIGWPLFHELHMVFMYVLGNITSYGTFCLIIMHVSRLFNYHVLTKLKKNN